MTTTTWRKVINCADFEEHPYHIYEGAQRIATIARHQGDEESSDLIATAPQIAAAAKVMLAALRSARTYLGDDATDDSAEARATRADLDSAIAQADSAGITAADPCPTCKGKGADAATGADCPDCFGGGDVITEER